MANLFKDNSYNVLGLDVSASQKEIDNRAKRIISLLKIDEPQDYESDIGLFKDFRTENSVKLASENLSNPPKRLKEYFFWFKTTDSEDENALKAIKDGNYEEAISTWEKSSTKETARGFVSKKNLSILNSILALTTGKKKYLIDSLNGWKSLIESDKFWEAFSKVYKLDDDTGTSEEVIKKFSNQASSHLADFYTDLSEKKEDDSYFLEFSKRFSVKSGKVIKELLNPVYKSIMQGTEKLNSVVVGRDGILDHQSLQEVKELIEQLQADFNKLIDLGLYDDSESMSLRDKAAVAIRRIYLDLYNDFHQEEMAVNLLEISKQIAGTSSFKTKLSQDSDQAEFNEKVEDISAQVNNLIAGENYEEALEIVEERLRKHNGDRKMNQFLLLRKKDCVSNIAARDYVQAKKDVDNGKFEEAKPKFDKVATTLTENIELFDFDAEKINNLIDEVKKIVASTTVKTIDNVDATRNQIVEIAKRDFKGKYEETILVLLVDAYIYSGLASLLKKIKNRSDTVRVLYTLGWFTVWFYGIGLIFFLIGWMYKNSD